MYDGKGSNCKSIGDGIHQLSYVVVRTLDVVQHLPDDTLRECV